MEGNALLLWGLRSPKMSHSFFSKTPSNCTAYLYTLYPLYTLFPLFPLFPYPPHPPARVTLNFSP